MSREAMQQAIKLMEHAQSVHAADSFPLSNYISKAQDILRAALAQGEAVPVAWADMDRRIVYWHDLGKVDRYHGLKPTTPLYAAPPPPAAPCPHIRSSGTGDWATHWCSLNGPAAPEINDPLSNTLNAELGTICLRPAGRATGDSQ